MNVRRTALRARLRAQSALASQAALLAGLLTLALCVTLRSVDPPLARQARLAVFDSYQRARPRPFEPMPVRICAIDDAALAAVGRWP